MSAGCWVLYVLLCLYQTMAVSGPTGSFSQWSGLGRIASEFRARLCGSADNAVQGPVADEAQDNWFPPPMEVGTQPHRPHLMAVIAGQTL